MTAAGSSRIVLTAGSMVRPVDPNDVKSTPTSTEDSLERGYASENNEARDPATYEGLGRSHRLDEDDEDWDIADEGRGHRG